MGSVDKRAGLGEGYGIFLADWSRQKIIIYPLVADTLVYFWGVSDAT